MRRCEACSNITGVDELLCQGLDPWGHIAEDMIREDRQPVSMVTILSPARERIFRGLLITGMAAGTSSAAIGARGLLTGEWGVLEGITGLVVSLGLVTAADIIAHPYSNS